MALLMVKHNFKVTNLSTFKCVCTRLLKRVIHFAVGHDECEVNHIVRNKIQKYPSFVMSQRANNPLIVKPDVVRIRLRRETQPEAVFWGSLEFTHWPAVDARLPHWSPE